MLFRHTLTLAAVLLASANAFALTTPTNFPADLLYKNQPIDPLCIFEAESLNQSVALDKCGINAQKNRKIIEISTDKTAQQFVGYDYASPLDPQRPNVPNAYSYYKVIGNTKGTYIIHALNNSGGSGMFSGIYFVKREGNQLLVNLITSGDRCNGSVKSVSFNNNVLSYSTHITPFDLFDLAKDDPHKVKAYDNLSDCAVCCEASVNYEADPSLPISEAKIVSIDLGKDTIVPNRDRPGDFQFCFDSVIADYQKAGKRIISLDQLKELVKTFNKRCFSNEAS